MKSPDKMMGMEGDPIEGRQDAATPPDMTMDGDAAISPTGCEPAGCDDQDDCTDDVCEGSQCKHVAHDDACSDDGSSCTDDLCRGGLCTHPSNNSCACKNADDCDDKNPCTADSCSPDKTCVYTDNTETCADDGNTCTRDVCSGGSCSHPANGTCECMAPSDCNDANECTDDACSDGKCVNKANTGSCADDGNACTDEVCAEKVCTHPANTSACSDDGTACTTDVCAAGVCTHVDNKTCECLSPADCDDKNSCTDDSCNSQGKCVRANNTAPCATDNNQCTCDMCMAGKCEHPSADMCAAGTPVVIDNFNSSIDWDANLTTPAKLAITGKTSFDGTNLEGDANLYLAESATASLEFVSPNLTGLKDLVLEIQSNQSDTTPMVKLGVFDSTKNAWVDRALTGYGTITAGSYATLTLPIADFAVSACVISKVRLDFNVSGGQKIFRVQGISAK